MAALYAYTGGGNWSDTTATWRTVSSSGSAAGVAPTASDDVIFDSGAIVAVVVDTTTCVAKTVTCQAAANIITFTAAKILTVSGNVTFYAAMTLSGTGNLTVNATATLTSAAVTFPGSLTFTLNGTMTLVGDWIVTGLVTNSTTTLTLNKTTAETLTCNGGLTVTGAMAGTVGIIIGGTGGIWSGSAVNLSNNLTFNCTTATVSGSVRYSTGTMTYTAGTITTTNSTLNLQGLGIILNTNGITWNNIIFGYGDTVTLTSNLTCSGTLSITALTSHAFSGAYNISCATLTVSASGNSSLTLAAGQILTVSTYLYLGGAPGTAVQTIKSGTASSATNLVYQGTAANCEVFAMTFTDVDASTSAQGIDNWQGGTLTRCTNITNRTTADFATAAQAAKIIEGTTISLIAGTYHEATEAEVQSGVNFGALSALTGSYAGGGGGGGSNRVICGIG